MKESCHKYCIFVIFGLGFFSVLALEEFQDAFLVLNHGVMSTKTIAASKRISFHNIDYSRTERGKGNKIIDDFSAATQKVPILLQRGGRGFDYSIRRTHISTSSSATRRRQIVVGQDDYEDSLWNEYEEIRKLTKQLSVHNFVSAGISLISCMILITMILRSYIGLGCTFHRLIFGLSIADTMTAIAYVLNSVLVPKEMQYMVWNASGNVSTCRFGGFILLLGGLGSMLYNWALCFYYVTVIKYEKSDEFIAKKIEPYLHAVAVSYTFLLAFVILGTDGYNWDRTNKCFPAKYFPPHCANDFEFESTIFDYSRCNRGEKSRRIVTSAIVPIYLATPVVFVVTMTMMYRAVLKVENKINNYGVAAIRDKVRGRLENKARSARREPDIEDLSLHKRILTFYRSKKDLKRELHKIASTRSARSNSTGSQSRSVFYRAVAYLTVFFICWMPIIITYFYNNGKANTFLDVFPVATVVSALTPLQGFCNLVLFLYPKVAYVKRNKKDNLSWFQALVKVLNSKGGKKQRIIRQYQRNPYAKHNKCYQIPVDGDANGANKRLQYIQSKRRLSGLTKVVENQEEEEKCEIRSPSHLSSETLPSFPFPVASYGESNLIDVTSNQESFCRNEKLGPQPEWARRSSIESNGTSASRLDDIMQGVPDHEWARSSIASNKSLSKLDSMRQGFANHELARSSITSNKSLSKLDSMRQGLENHELARSSIASNKSLSKLDSMRQGLANHELARSIIASNNSLSELDSMRRGLADQELARSSIASNNSVSELDLMRLGSAEQEWTAGNSSRLNDSVSKMGAMMQGLTDQEWTRSSTRSSVSAARSDTLIQGVKAEVEMEEKMKTEIENKRTPRNRDSTKNRKSIMQRASLRASALFQNRRRLKVVREKDDNNGSAVLKNLVAIQEGNALFQFSSDQDCDSSYGSNDDNNINGSCGAIDIDTNLYPIALGEDMSGDELDKMAMTEEIRRYHVFDFDGVDLDTTIRPINLNDIDRDELNECIDLDATIPHIDLHDIETGDINDGVDLKTTVSQINAEETGNEGHG